MKGFFLPLSGGIDSASVALIVFSMCHLVFDSIHDDQVAMDVRSIINGIPSSAKDLMGKLLFTSYMKSKNSSQVTQSRAERLCKYLGATHFESNIDSIVFSFEEQVSQSLNINLKHKREGGTHLEDISLQNIQARSRMLLSYLFAQSIPASRGQDQSLLVLGTSNVDEWYLIL